MFALTAAAAYTRAGWGLRRSRMACLVRRSRRYARAPSMGLAHLAALVAVVLGCGPGERRVSEDLDTTPARGRDHRVARCTENCQSIDWVDREALSALADIAVCLKEPTYAPAGLRGTLT